ncbi:MAG: TRAM domain-containing protein, partial [Lachnospiraceae bacterium]|nr:TRAM domain-containing protein [Lachnospiraceae bacterium]
MYATAAKEHYFDMKKNDIIHMTITDCGVQGEGIGRFDGMPFFVPGAAIGDTITAGITKLKKTYGYARLIEVEQPSADRVEPPCPVASICGGCTLMHLSYERQLSWKASVVEN